MPLSLCSAMHIKTKAGTASSGYVSIMQRDAFLLVKLLVRAIGENYRVNLKQIATKMPHGAFESPRPTE